MGEASYFDTTGTLVTIAAQSNGTTNMVVVAPTTTFIECQDFDNGGSDAGRIRYTGNETLHFHCACTWSCLAATGNDVFVLGVAKNGTVVASSKIINTLAANAVQGNAIHVIVELAKNDYLELYIGNLTAGRNATIRSLNLFAMGAPCDD
jgi:hypothetical protein